MHADIPIIIPAFQPSETLLGVVKPLQQKGFQCIVVDDGSGVAFASIFNAIRDLGITVLQHPTNQGKGQALKTAFQYVRQTLQNAIGVVTADADGQHLPEDIAKIVEALALAPTHFILGKREFSQKIPLRSKFGNIFTRYMFAFLIGKKIEDTQTGLRGIPYALLQPLCGLKSNGYAFELEMLIYAVQHHIGITEVAIHTVYENNNASSHFNPLFDSAKIYFIFLRFSLLGLITALLDLAVFSVCFMLTHTIFFTECLARISGGLFSFTVGKHVVFQSQGQYKTEIIKYLALWIGLLLVSYAMIKGAYLLGMNVYLSKILTQIILFFASFSIQRFVIFPYKPK